MNVPTTDKRLNEDGRIDWPNLTREEAARLSNIQQSVRRERRWLEVITRSTLNVEAKREGIQNISRYNKPDLVMAVIGHRFMAVTLPEVDRVAAKEAVR